MSKCKRPRCGVGWHDQQDRFWICSRKIWHTGPHQCSVTFLHTAPVAQS